MNTYDPNYGLGDRLRDIKEVAETLCVLVYDAAMSVLTSLRPPRRQ
jgi:hypothetical protein